MRPLLHYAPHLFSLSLIIIAVAGWLPDGGWLWAVVALAAAATAGTAADMLFHRGRLCEPCAAQVPLNGGELAARYRHPFRVWHWMSSRVWLWPAAIIALVVVTLPLPGPVATTLLCACFLVAG